MSKKATSSPSPRLEPSRILNDIFESEDEEVTLVFPGVNDNETYSGRRDDVSGTTVNLRINNMHGHNKQAYDNFVHGHSCN